MSAKIRPQDPPPSASEDESVIRAHLLRLQEGGLLDSAAGTDIKTQRRTEAGVGLWAVFTETVRTAQVLGMDLSDQDIELLAEQVLAVAADPALIDTVHRAGEESAARPGPGQAPIVREPDNAPTLDRAAVDRLALLYERLDDWHRSYFPQDGRTGAASTRSRSRAAAPDTPAAATKPEGSSSKPRPRRR